MSTPQTAITASDDPTKKVYVDDNDIRLILNWGRRMPNGGRLGDVTYGSLQKKLIQVFDASEDGEHNKTWQFQAQDGSFLLSMYVQADQNLVTFLNSRKGNFPLVTVYARFP